LPLPAKGSSKRPLALAVNLTRALGSAGVIIGAVLLILVGISSPVLADIVLHMILAIIFLLYIGPGVALVVLSFPLERRKMWGAITVLVIAGLQVPLLLFVMVRSAMEGVSDPLYLAINIGLPAAVCVMAVVTIVYLAMAMPYLRAVARARQVGFEPVIPAVSSVQRPGSVGPPQ
jgi:hypothetical protein